MQSASPRFQSTPKTFKTSITSIALRLVIPWRSGCSTLTAVSTLSRSIFNGAGAAATAQREAALTSIDAQEKWNEKRSYDGSGSTSKTALGLWSRSVSKAALMPGGYSPERERLLAAQGKSNLAYNRIIGLARNQPFEAGQLLEKYKSEGLLFGPQLQAATDKVQGFTESVGTDIIANKVMDQYRLPDGTFSKSAAEMREEAVQQAKSIYPTDPKIGTATQAAFDKNFNQHNWAVHQDELAVKQQMSDYITKGVVQVAQLPPDLVKRMSPAQIREFPIVANTYRSALNKQTNQDQYDRLLGLYNNDNAKFMDTNVLQIEGLSKGNIDFFLKLQRQASANGDPRVARAMGWLKNSVPGTLNELGIIGSSKSEDSANKFVGALHEAIQAWQEERGKATY